LWGCIVWRGGLTLVEPELDAVDSAGSLAEPVGAVGTLAKPEGAAGTLAEPAGAAVDAAGGQAMTP
jgi:hypothetical protein